MEELKYVRVLFTIEGKMKCEVDRWINAASAVMRALCQTVMVKTELSQVAKLSIYQSVYIPTLTFVHKL